MEVEEEAEESKMRPNDENADDDRVVGDDDDRLREMAEERVGNIDPDEVSPQILDNTLMVYIVGYYDAYYKYRTESNAETRYEWTMNQTDRLDIDKLGPMNGFDDDGNLRPPTTSTLRPWFDKKAKPVPVLENEMMWEDRPFDAMLTMIETAIKVEKIMAFLVETGLSPNDIKFYMPTVEDKADASRRARMRRIISNFIARSIKGAYPEISTYTYFRDQDDVRDYGTSCLRLPAVGIYYMVRKRYRNLDVAIIAAQCGVRLPRVLQLQVDYAWAKAMADSARGKTQRLNTLMPSAPERVQDVAAIVDETSTSFVQGTRASQPGSQAASSSSKGPTKGKEKGKDKGKDKGKEKGKDDKGKGKDKGFSIERRTMDGWSKRARH
eukprot:s645_g28.t1